MFIKRGDPELITQILVNGSESPEASPLDEMTAEKLEQAKKAAAEPTPEQKPDGNNQDN